MRSTLILIVVLSTTASKSGLAQQADLRSLISYRQPEIQDQIDRAYKVFLGAGRDDLKTDCEAFEEIQKLKDITKDKGEIVRQLAIFVATTTSEEDRHLVAAATTLEYLDLPPSIPIRVLAPYLDVANRNLRDFAQIWFRYHDSHERIHGRPPLGSVNYYSYMEYVRNRLVRNEEIPPAFIEYIYERHPDKALLVFAHANRQAVAAGQLLIMRKQFDAAQEGGEIAQGEIRQEWQQQKTRQQQAKIEQREILLAEHIVSNAIWLNENEFTERFQTALPEALAELAKLAKHDKWWVRLYVAVTMQQYRELRQPDDLQQLRKDSNTLVRKAAASVGE